MSGAEPPQDANSAPRGQRSGESRKRGSFNERCRAASRRECRPPGGSAAARAASVGGSMNAAEPPQSRGLAGYQATHFRYETSVDGKVATITLDRPGTQESADLRRPTRNCATSFARSSYASDVKAVVVTGEGGNFCSGGDVHEIIGPLTRDDACRELLAFTRMTGDLVLAMRKCPQPIVAAIDGVCAGAGAMIALAADLRLGTRAAKTAFLFMRVGLAGCDMGACTLLPRMIGQGRAAELLLHRPRR